MLFSMKQDTPPEIIKKMKNFIADQKDIQTLLQKRTSIADASNLIQFYSHDPEYIIEKVFPNIDKWIFKDQFYGYFYRCQKIRHKVGSFQKILMKIRTIDFGKLFYLGLRDNRIRNIEGLIYLNLQSVQQVDLSRNQVCCLKPLAKFHGLLSSSKLFLQDNPFQEEEYFWLMRCYFGFYNIAEKEQKSKKEIRKSYQFGLDIQNYNLIEDFVRDKFQNLFKLDIRYIKNNVKLAPDRLTCYKIFEQLKERFR